ncbi:hypothetical protein ACIQAC_01995 [Streptomyces sp. NPDC088387]|uniref:hypothetical protein n=1 Tax=Streptomyces sp. NPDC088387 TaxID=3365859 RepID=UPI0037F139DA
MNTERPDTPDNPDEDAVGRDDAEVGAADTNAKAEAEAGTGAETEAETEAAAEAEAAVEAEATTEAGDSDLSDAREEPLPAARRRSPVLIASVAAAAVLLVGGGGAFLATSASGGGDGGGAEAGAPDGGTTPPPLALDGYAEREGILPGEPDPNGSVYRADGELPQGPRSAAVYTAKGEVSEADVVRLAEALGMTGKPVTEGDAWRIGGQDGQGPTLRVNRQAPGTWTFTRYAPGTDDCQSPAKCVKPPVSPAGDPVSEGDATEAAAPVLKAVGQDDAKVDAGQVVGAQRMVNAEPRVDGLPTYGWTTHLAVSGQGELVNGSGQLKAQTKGATYPVLSAERTLEQLNASPSGGGVGIGGCAEPVPLEGQPESSSCETSVAPPKPETITVENAVFGLAPHYVEARQTLVPSWLFEVRAPGAQDSFTVTHPAVDPKYLAPAAPSTAPTQPSPRPTGPGDKSTAAPIVRDVDVQGYTAEGRELTVAFTGGVCADYEATVDESGDRVAVTVTETSQPGEICIQIAKVHHRTVQLDEPLGARKVVGTDSRAVPLEKPGARLPE